MIKLYVSSEFVKEEDDVMGDDNFKHKTVGHEDDFSSLKAERMMGLNIGANSTIKGIS
jgi:hypothetical protein